MRGALPLFADKRSPWGRAFAAFAAGLALARLAARDSAAALNVALPAATLALTPPRLGFAAYFGAWHAPRHLALVLERDTAAAPFANASRGSRAKLRATRSFALGLGAVAFTFMRDADSHELFVALTLGVRSPIDAPSGTPNGSTRARRHEVRPAAARYRAAHSNCGIT